MPGLDFLQDLTIVLVVAGLAGWLCQSVGLSSVVGFLLAGIVIGPFTPPFSLVSDIERIHTLSQLGLVFLMFSVGMGLSIRRLRSMGLGMVLATALGAFLVFSLTRALGMAMGWTPSQALFLAAILMASSSAIINKVLHEIGATHEPASRRALTVTVLEDVVAVVLLTLLTSATQTTPGEGAGGGMILQTLGLILEFVIVIVIVGLLIVPRFLKLLSKSADVDLQTILVVGMVLGGALLAVRAGYSLALGAFVLGAIVAETAQRTQVERYVQGLRDLFTAVFFVSIGMLMDVKEVGQSWLLILALGVFTLVVRTFACTTSLVLIGHPTRDAVRSGLMLSPIGEFSFIIAQLGVASKLAPPLLYPLAVGISLFTALTAPFLIRHSGRISREIERWEPRFLKEMIGHYHALLREIGSRQQGSVLWRLSQKRVAQIAVGAVFVTGVLAYSKAIYSRVFEYLGTDLPLPTVWKAVFWGLLGVMVLAPVLAIWRNLGSLAMIYAEALTQGTKRARILQPALRTGLLTVFAVAIFIWLWLLLPVDFSALWTVLTIGLVLVLLVFLLRRKLIWLHSKIEVELEEALAAPNEKANRDVQELVSPHHDWNIHVHELEVPDAAECAGKKLSELQLRSQFGCSVAGVDRHGYPLPNPAPDLVLYPGDRLLLLATPEQMVAVRKFIGRTVPHGAQTGLIDEIEMQGVRVPAGSVAADKMLIELEIPAKTGVQIVGIERNGHRLLNPGPFQSIETGDDLLALGTHQQIAALERWLQPS